MAMDLFRSVNDPGLKKAVLQTLAYADVFDYPLTAEEIYRYLPEKHLRKEEVERFLREDSLVWEKDGYFTLPGREGLVEVRRRREQISAQLWPWAIWYGRVIAGIPFVRMVAVTGSLAMNNVEREPDIDYLIVTASGRVWMVRAMVLAVARAAAAHGVRLCPNYLVSEDALVFPNQTLYAAHELAQMIPLFGLDIYERIGQLNPWKEDFLPNAEGLPASLNQSIVATTKPALKRFCESILRTLPGEWFEQWEMQRKISRLTREQSNSPESCFTGDTCKGHNLRHGQRTERVLRERLEGLFSEIPL